MERTKGITAKDKGEQIGISDLRKKKNETARHEGGSGSARIN